MRLGISGGLVAVVVGLAWCRMGFTSQHTDHAFRDAFGAELGRASAVPEFVALAVECAGLLDLVMELANMLHCFVLGVMRAELLPGLIVVDMMLAVMMSDGE